MTEARKPNYSALAGATSAPNSWPKPQSFTKASAAHLAVIAELNTRYPLPNGADEDQHQRRLRLLADDCADIPPDILRAASRMVAQDSPWLPSASELRKAAGRIATQPRDGETWLQRKVRETNLDNIAKGSPLRCVIKGENLDIFNTAGPGERRICDGQGGVIVPYWSEARKDWVYSRGSN